MLKVQQQVSGTCRDDTGAEAFCRIRSSISTLRKHARHVLTALEPTCPDSPPMPSLLPE